VLIQHGGILIFVTSKWRIRHKVENLVSRARGSQRSDRCRLVEWLDHAPALDVGQFKSTLPAAMAAHAARLTSVAERHTVARALRRAVRDATDTRATQTGRVPMHRANIASAEALIAQVALRLHAPHPVSARGMARLRQLLSDGTGPLYRHGSGDLAGRLRAVLAAL